jgi:hypothetical protein
MTYSIRYKKKWWLPWKTVNLLIGHKYDPTLDRMLFFKEDGSLLELANWSSFDVALGLDWVLATKKLMEKEAGQPIQLAVNANT